MPEAKVANAGDYITAAAATLERPFFFITILGPLARTALREIPLKKPCFPDIGQKGK